MNGQPGVHRKSTMVLVGTITGSDCEAASFLGTTVTTRCVRSVTNSCRTASNSFDTSDKRDSASHRCLSAVSWYSEKQKTKLLHTHLRGCQGPAQRDDGGLVNFNNAVNRASWLPACTTASTRTQKRTQVHHESNFATEDEGRAGDLGGCGALAFCAVSAACDDAQPWRFHESKDTITIL